MQKILNSSLLFLAIACLISFFQSCKQKGEEKQVGPARRIQDVVSQDILDNLKARGMLINLGNTPPKLDFSVLISPMQLLSRYGEDDHYEVGRIIPDVHYRFYGQTEGQEITYEDESNVHSGEGQGAFIIGTDNRFTIYSEEEKVSWEKEVIRIKTVAIISGMLDGRAIRDFQYAFVVTEKTGDDYDQYVMPVGTSRIWVDGNGISESISNVRMSVSGNRHSGAPASVR